MNILGEEFYSGNDNLESDSVFSEEKGDYDIDLSDMEYREDEGSSKSMDTTSAFDKKDEESVEEPSRTDMGTTSDHLRQEEEQRKEEIARRQESRELVAEHYYGCFYDASTWWDDKSDAYKEEFDANFNRVFRGREKEFVRYCALARKLYLNGMEEYDNMFRCIFYYFENYNTDQMNEQLTNSKTWANTEISLKKGKMQQGAQAKVDAKAKKQAKARSILLTSIDNLDVPSDPLKSRHFEHENKFAIKSRLRKDDRNEGTKQRSRKKRDERLKQRRGIGVNNKTKPGDAKSVPDEPQESKQIGDLSRGRSSRSLRSSKDLPARSENETSEEYFRRVSGGAKGN